ncbi:TPA: hypothetical protein SMI27_000829 [Serratia liquefaciens]|nr:hypothetical protein [Serratia liquefaciens]
MDNKLSELSKPVAWPNGCNETAVEALRYLAEKPRPSYGNSPFNAEHLYMIASEIKRMADQPLYSQEYVSALLARIEELEKKETWRERQSVIDGLAGAGEAWSDIEEYMVKWDEERRNG